MHLTQGRLINLKCLGYNRNTMVFMPMGFKINFSSDANRRRLHEVNGYLPEDIPLLESFRILENGEPINDINLRPEDYRNFINWLGKGPQKPIPDVVLRILCHYKSVVKAATADVNNTDGMRLKQTNLIKTIEELIKGGDDNIDPDLMCLDGGAPQRADVINDDCCNDLRNRLTVLAELVRTRMGSDEGETLRGLLNGITEQLRNQVNNPAPQGECLNANFQRTVIDLLTSIDYALDHSINLIGELRTIIEEGFDQLSYLIHGVGNAANAHLEPQSPSSIEPEPRSPNYSVNTSIANATNINSLVDNLNAKIGELTGILSILKPAEGSTEEFNSLQTYLKTKFDSVIDAIQSKVLPPPDFSQLQRRIEDLFSNMVTNITDRITASSEGVANPELINLLKELKSKPAIEQADITRLETLINNLPKPPEDVSRNIDEIKTLLRASQPVSLEAIRQLIQTQPALKEADKANIRALLEEIQGKQDYTQVLQQILEKPSPPAIDAIKVAITADLTQGILADMRSDIAEGMEDLKRNIDLANKNIQSILGRKKPRVDLAGLGDKAVAKFAEAEREVEEGLRRLKEMNANTASANAMEELERNVIKLRVAAKLHAEQAEELYALNSNISSASAEGNMNLPTVNALQAPPESTLSESSEKPSYSAPLKPSAEGLPQGWNINGPDEEGNYWYVNKTSGASSWNRPLVGGATKGNTRRVKKVSVDQSLNELNTELSGFRKKISLKRRTNSNTKNALETQIADFKAQLTACEAELTLLKQSVSSSSATVDGKEAEASRLMEKITQLKKIIVKVIGEGKENAQFEPLIDAHMKAFSDLATERDALEESLRKLTTDCATKDAQIRTLEAEFLTQKTLLGQLHAQLAGAGTNATAIAELRGKLADCERKQAEIAGQKVTLEDEATDLRTRLAEARVKLTELEKIKAVIKAKVTGEVPDNMIERSINSYLRDNKSELARLEDENARLATEGGRLRGLLAQKEGEITRLTSAVALAPSTADKARAERELAECKDAYARLKAERDEIDNMNRQITMELETYRQRDTGQGAYPLTERPVGQPTQPQIPSYMRSTAASKGRMDVAQGQLNQLYGKGTKGASGVNYNARAQRRRGGRRTRKGVRLPTEQHRS